MNSLVHLTSTGGLRIGRNETKGDPAEGIRGVDADIDYHDRSSNAGRGRGLDVLYPGVNPIPPVLADHYEVDSTTGDDIGADDIWTTACRVHTCINSKTFTN